MDKAPALTKTDKLALFITNKIGTMGFFYICVILVTVPLFLPPTMPIVQYISSGYLQLILLPLILVSQNLQNRHAEIRAQRDYETNIKAEMEIEKDHKLMLEVLKRLEKLENKK